MHNERTRNLALGVLAAVIGAGVTASAAAAQDVPTLLPALVAKAAPPCRLSLDEARTRALGNSKALQLALLVVEEKEHERRSVQAAYAPKVGALALYAHFDKFLGTVLTGPLGNTRSVPVLNQDQRFAAVHVTQPLTPLFKIRQAVRIARADEQIAQIHVEKARRELAAGVEQLYFGLLAAQRIQAQTLFAYEAANKLAQAAGTVEARLGALQALQGVQAAGKEVAGVGEQLNSLLDLPLCTPLELAEPGPLPAPVTCADETIALALGASPDIREAQQNIEKAEAGVRLGKLAYVPDVAVVGFSAAQDAVPAIQNGFSGVSVVGTVTLFEGGKRRQVVLQRKTLLALAQQNLRVAEDKVRLEAQKTYREFVAAGEASVLARDVLGLRREAAKAAQGPAAQKAAVEELIKAEIEAVKAELGQRQAYAQLLRVIGRE